MSTPTGPRNGLFFTALEQTMQRQTRGNRDFALGRLKQGAMNKTEEAYAAHLELMKRAGEVLWFKFEGVKLRLADSTFYSPDFVVMGRDRELQMHEVKGFWRDDARVKVKVAAGQYPFRFVIVTARAKRDGGGFNVEPV